VALAPDGLTLATGGDDATVYLWDGATGRQKSAFRDLGSAFSPDGKTLATGGEDRLVKLWDVRSLADSVR
jgi:WD40 repeat protein